MRAPYDLGVSIFSNVLFLIHDFWFWFKLIWCRSSIRPVFEELKGRCMVLQECKHCRVNANINVLMISHR